MSQRFVWRYTRRVQGYIDQLRRRRAVMPTRLDIFDFDNTLFSSPPPSFTWTESSRGVLSGMLNWWQHPHTLERVVEHQHLLWNEATVLLLRESVNDPQSLTVVLTGREEHFESMLRQLLEQINALPDLVITKQVPPSYIRSSTLLYKQDFIRHVLGQLPSLRSLRIYDDRHRHVAAFQEFAANLLAICRLDDAQVYFVNTGERGAGHLAWEAELAIAQQLLADWISQQAPLYRRGQPQHLPEIQQLGLSSAIHFTDDALTHLAGHIERPPTSAPYICLPEAWTRLHHRVVWLDEQPTEEHSDVDVTLTATRIVQRQHSINVELSFVDQQGQPRSLVLPLFTNHFLNTKRKPGKEEEEEEQGVDERVLYEQPVSVAGRLTRRPRFHISLQPEVAVPQVPKIRIGALVCKYSPLLEGADIGRAVKQVRRWMDDKGIVDEAGGGRDEQVEQYISALSASGGFASRQPSYDDERDHIYRALLAALESPALYVCVGPGPTLAVCVVSLTLTFWVVLSSDEIQLVPDEFAQPPESSSAGSVAEVIQRVLGETGRMEAIADGVIIASDTAAGAPALKVGIAQRAVLSVYPYVLSRLKACPADTAAAVDLSRCVLAINPDCTTAINCRQRWVQHMASERQFCRALLTHRPKSASVWRHYEWTITQQQPPVMDEETARQELAFVRRMVARTARSYYAWKHRLWLAHGYLTEALLEEEMEEVTRYVRVHSRDYSALHYRLQMMVLRWCPWLMAGQEMQMGSRGGERELLAAMDQVEQQEWTTTTVPSQSMAALGRAHQEIRQRIAAAQR
ncbi:hypothetical protein RI367_007446 [Sorochytrium milnesiophthora]